MKKRFPRPSWAVTLPIAGLAVAYTLLVFLPGKREIDGLRAEIRTRQTYVTETARLVEALRQTEQELQATQDYGRTLAAGAAAEGDTTRLFGQIAKLADEADTKTTRFEPEPVVDYNSLRQIPLSMACEGSFSAVCQLLKGLEQLPQRIWVQDLTLESAGENGGITRCELKLAIFAGKLEVSN